MRILGRVSTVAALAATTAVLAAGPAAACGGLIGPNGAVNLTRTSTFAGYHNGVEHYVTAFNFAGGGGKFGSITPLPGVPSSVVKGGDWTLQRLIRETQPVTESGAFFDGAARSTAASAPAEVLLETKVDALDITVLKGGGTAVGLWAKEHGFRLPPDAPDVLDFYAERSPIFLAAAFDADRARQRGQAVGDGTPVHITIPTPNPWVPLRILGLGKQAAEPVDADVYLLTDRKPALLPKPVDGDSVLPGDRPGIVQRHSAAATDSLLADLRSDRGMEWIPAKDMWLTKIVVEARAGALTHDLAIDASGQGTPSRVAAGLAAAGSDLPLTRRDDGSRAALAIGLLVAVLCTAAAVGAIARRQGTPSA